MGMLLGGLHVLVCAVMSHWQRDMNKMAHASSLVNVSYFENNLLTSVLKVIESKKHLLPVGVHVGLYVLLGRKQLTKRVCLHVSEVLLG